MGKLITVSGGIKSGKSTFAESLADVSPRLFIATAKAYDPEMHEKIFLHKLKRKNWDVLVSPIPSEDELSEINKIKSYKCILIDCIGFFLFNSMQAFKDPEGIVLSFVEYLKNHIEKSIVVTNEVGLSIVYPNPLSRKFANLLGNINQKLLDISDNFFLIMAGSALKIK